MIPTEEREANQQNLGEQVIPCLCDQAEWPNAKRVNQIRIKPNRRAYPLTFKVCRKCRYVVGMEDPDPDEKLDRSSPIVRTIARMLEWKLSQ